MNYIFKNISYDLPDPFGLPAVTAELELIPETRRECTDIVKALYSMNYEDVTKLGLVFNSRPTLPSIKNVYFNPPATVVLWNDGTKTVVKCQDGDAYSKETGLALCMAKKAMGNSSRQFNDIFKRWIPEEKVDLSYRGDCTSCKYCDLSEDEYPCHNCILTNWEPAK